MKIISLSFALLSLSIQLLFAQQVRFITTGTIEFEKSVNTYALIRRGQISGKNLAGMEKQLLEQYQQSNPQFKVLKSTLAFSNDKALFSPVDVDPVSGAGFTIPMAAQNNIIYTDRSAGMLIAKKNILGDNFLLTDSVRKINWKITNETREVAGFACRRANAMIMDSIYVVAFYAENIHVSGGPEGFGGLPGMILEVALPHENISWHATKVTDMPVTPNTLIAPRGGRAIDRKKLMEMLSDAVKNKIPQDANLLMKTNLL
jgi:GLPGLI family protein